MTTSRVTYFTFDFDDAYKVSLTYATPNDATKWLALGLIDEMKMFGANEVLKDTKGNKPHEDIHGYFRDIEENYGLFRQDAIYNGCIQPSLKVFDLKSKERFCIHSHDKKLYPLYGMACAYTLTGGNAAPDFGSVYKPKASKKKKDEFMQPLSDTETHIFRAKYQFNDNLDLACNTVYMIDYDVDASQFPSLTL